MNFLKQSDFKKEEENISKAGCLMITLLTIAQKMVGKALTKEEILFIYKHLIKRGFMLDGKDRSTGKLIKKSSYILNHEAVINEGLSFLVTPCIRVKYVGCRYVEDATGVSWGKTEGDFIVLHVRALAGVVHFRLIDFDPAEPEVKFDEIISIRYYKLKEIKHGRKKEEIQ